MSRCLIPSLMTPFPLSRQLPSMLQADDFVVRFCGALDEVVAPVLGVLDQIEAYFDSRLAPRDFVQWLAGWMGLAVEESWPDETTRAAVAGAMARYRRQGTREGIAESVALVFGGTADVIESGGTAVSEVPGGALPGSDRAEIVVRLSVDDVDAVDVRRLDDVVAAVKPAHVRHQVEVVAAEAER